MGTVAGENNLKIKFGFLLFSTAIIASIFIGRYSKGNNHFMTMNYVITETTAPDSFDPLLADKSNNILMMRMLYHSPIQINSSNVLVSNVLEKFEYNPKNFKIRFIVKKNIGQFSDGTEIDKKDVLIAILRMAYFKPDFPVIKDIAGVREWANKKEGLLSLPLGIIFNGDEITIELVKHNQNALFRFCLELFSIIPTKCIDLTSGKLTCDKPAFSGYYELENRTEKEYKFKLRIEQSKRAEEIKYETITFQYKTFLEACKQPMSQNTIISGTDIGFNSTQCSSMFKSDQIHLLQASRFGAVLFNPNVKPFNSAPARRFFANKIREYFSKNKANMIVSKSLFSHLLPGYLDDAIFPPEDNSFSIDKSTSIAIADFANPVAQMVSEAVAHTSQELNINYTKLNDEVTKNTENFLNNKLGYNLSTSGFWPQDPIGDVSMFFTKDLHSALKFLWQDKKMYELINAVEVETNSYKIKTKMEDLNRHLYEESLIVPVIHFRRLYITHESVKTLNIPLAVTSPAPWHLIPTE